MNYDVRDWYWKADDGRVFASARQVIVNESDAGYVEFKKADVPTPWPRIGDNQTEAALQEVLLPYNIFVTLKDYAADARWRKEQGGMSVTVTGGPLAIKTDDRSQAKINGARLAAESKNAPAGATTEWVAADNSIRTLGVVDVVAMSDQLQKFVSACFKTYKTVVDGITAGSITTRQQVDSAFANMTW